MHLQSTCRSWLCLSSYFRLQPDACSSRRFPFDLFLFFPQQVTEAPDWNKVNICILMKSTFCCPTGILWPIGIISSLICIQKVTGLLVHLLHREALACNKSHCQNSMHTYTQTHTHMHVQIAMQVWIHMHTQVIEDSVLCFVPVWHFFAYLECNER